MRRIQLSKQFLSDFTVDEAAPFRRHLNRLEVEVGREDYSHLKRVELLAAEAPEARFAAMEEITGRVLATTQNAYNRQLLRRLGIRVFLDPAHYEVFYRWQGRTLRFTPVWRQRTLRRFFGRIPVADTGWQPCAPRLPGFESRFLPDRSGGVLLLRSPASQRPLLTATHGPYDPHTLEATLFFLRSGKGGAALINLGFSGREPLTDANLERLKGWELPLNPSNIDVIYPYADQDGHPHCYKLEENLRAFVERLEIRIPETIIDIHGCVGTRAEDRRLVVGMGGESPFPRLTDLGRVTSRRTLLHLAPRPRLRQALQLLRELSDEIYLQCCESPRCGHLFFLLHSLDLLGRRLDPRAESASLLSGEDRPYLPAEDLRWLPGAGGNALQRREALKMRSDMLCLHVEIPTLVRRKIALKLREEEIGASLDASAL